MGFLTCASNLHQPNRIASHLMRSIFLHDAGTFFIHLSSRSLMISHGRKCKTCTIKISKLFIKSHEPNISPVWAIFSAHLLPSMFRLYRHPYQEHSSPSPIPCLLYVQTFIFLSHSSNRRKWSNEQAQDCRCVHFSIGTTFRQAH